MRWATFVPGEGKCWRDLGYKHRPQGFGTVVSLLYACWSPACNKHSLLCVSGEPAFCVKANNHVKAKEHASGPVFSSLWVVSGRRPHKVCRWAPWWLSPGLSLAPRFCSLSASAASPVSAPPSSGAPGLYTPPLPGNGGGSETPLWSLAPGHQNGSGGNVLPVIHHRRAWLRVIQLLYLDIHRLCVSFPLGFSAQFYLMFDSFNSLDELFLPHKNTHRLTEDKLKGKTRGTGELLVLKPWNWWRHYGICLDFASFCCCFILNCLMETVKKEEGAYLLIREKLFFTIGVDVFVAALVHSSCANLN